MDDRKKCVVLLSGGLDSATCLAIAKSQDFLVYALSFHYQQRHWIEVEAAGRVARALGVAEHMVLNLPLGRIGGSALTDDWDVPKNNVVEEMAKRIPITYVPARNTIFLSFALAWAEVLNAFDIFIGVNALDYSGYPDCRPEYIAAFQKMAKLATQMSVEHGTEITVHTPLIELGKADIIRKGIELGLDYGITHSCYDPDLGGAACGRCDSCLSVQGG
jgi:7-cyano-7-deazaguanine synthase